MAYEMHLDNGHNRTPIPYDVAPIQEEGYDFKNVIQSSANGVTYYAAELVVSCGELSVTTLTIFCHLEKSTTPVSNALFYSTHVPPNRNITFVKVTFDEHPEYRKSIDMDAAGNVRYTQTYTDFDYNLDGYGIAIQFVYWSHK